VSVPGQAQSGEYIRPVPFLSDSRSFACRQSTRFPVVVPHHFLTSGSGECAPHHDANFFVTFCVSFPSCLHETQETEPLPLSRFAPSDRVFSVSCFSTHDFACGPFHFSRYRSSVILNLLESRIASLFLMLSFADPSPHSSSSS